MTYIGSSWDEQYYTTSPEVFTVSAISNNTFALSRPISSPSAIQLFINQALVPSAAEFYITEGNNLVIRTPLNLGDEVRVRYLTGNTKVVDITAPGTLPVSAFETFGTADETTFLSGQGGWTGVGIPIKTVRTAYIAQASDSGTCIVIDALNNVGLTINANIFAIGDVFNVYNSPDASVFAQSITPGAGVTLIEAGVTPVPGSPVEIQNGGLWTFLCVGIDTFVYTGSQ